MVGIDAALDLDRVRELVRLFNRMRPLLFTLRESCLLASVALAEFLAFYNVLPQFVFGVTSKPFSAHCWLQHDGIVINDDPENVLGFTPILVL
jgi:hypothetical protein